MCTNYFNIEKLLQKYNRKIERRILIYPNFIRTIGRSLKNLSILSNMTNKKKKELNTQTSKKK